MTSSEANTTPPTSVVRSEQIVRIIPTLYPPLDLFEDLAPPEDWEAIIEIESLTNDRLRDEVGDISLVPAEERFGGPGATTIMAAFTHLGTSRFSDGSYGVYYAGLDMETAVLESARSRERFYSDSSTPALSVDMRVHYGTVDGTLHDVRGGYPEVHQPEAHGPAQQLGRRLREGGSFGVAYDSVRRSGGQCIAVFRPSILKNERPSHTWSGPVLKYHWDSQRIDKYFDPTADEWIRLEK